MTCGFLSNGARLLGSFLRKIVFGMFLGFRLDDFWKSAGLNMPDILAGVDVESCRLNSLSSII